MSKIEKYALRLDNSICDVVRFRTPNGISDLNGTNPKSKEWVDKVFPFRYGVIYCHQNPDSNVDRKVYVYVDPNKTDDYVSDHEIEISNFNVTPKKLFELLKDKNYIENMCLTNLDNLLYVFPNIVKRDKILNDGETFALVKNLDAPHFPEILKEKLRSYDDSKKDSTFVPSIVNNTSDNLGKVTGVFMKEYLPVEVTFPNGFIGRFYTEDLILFHEVNT